MLGVLSTASAEAPPRISLDLEGMSEAYKLSDSIVRNHDLGYKQGDGSDVRSRQDWTEKCPAHRYETREELMKKCPFPVARGYDHHDQEIIVTTRVYLVDKDLMEITEPEKITLAKVDFHKRSTYLFKYDANDRAGNHAEQVVFALIIDDSTAPEFTDSCAGALSVEAASSWSLCELKANDNIDGDLSADIMYSVKKIEGQGASEEELMHEDCTTFSCAKAVFSPQVQTGKHDCDQYLNCGPVTLGKYLITAKSVDKAGVYGQNAANNVGTKHIAIVVKDTQGPVIQFAGHTNFYHECVSDAKFADEKTRPLMEYIDAGADALDMLDTWALKKTSKKYTTTPTVYTFEHGDIPGTTFFNKLEDDEQQHSYTVSYTGEDLNGNTAEEVKRTVITVDTVAPTIVLKGSEIEDEYAKSQVNHNAGSEAGAEATVDDLGIDAGVSTDDLCDDVIDDRVTTSWGPKPWNVRSLGKYIRTYTVTDKRLNSATVTRTFNVVDTQEPEIIVQGADYETYEASRDVEYTDKGAKCKDFVDGDRSHAVEVSGEVVNMRMPGTYALRYDCSDLTGNQAEPKYRHVTIEDTHCPEVTLIGAAINYVEAGFPYVDLGASATDTLDGDLTQYIWTEGNTVTTSQAFYSRRSCEEIKQNLLSEGQAAENGEYFITAILTDEHSQGLSLLGAAESSRFHRVLVHCWMAPEPAVTFKVFELRDCEHVHHSLSTECHLQKDCPRIGMVKLEPTVELKTYIAEVKPHVMTVDDGWGDKTDTTYLCGEDGSAAKDGQWAGYTADEVKHAKYISTAEQGKYVIQFHVSDKAGNKECEKTKRTVIVKDTLPPVISLHLHKDTTMKLIHQSFGSQTGINGEENPAGLTEAKAGDTLHPHYFNPHLKDYPASGLMAEVGAHSWVMAAAASAVAGVALLANSVRSTTGAQIPV